MEVTMNDKILRTMAAAIVALAGLVSALPSAAAVIDLDGTIYISAASASPNGRCAPAITITNENVTTTLSNLGSFVFNMSECIYPPPPTSTFDGLFSMDFADGSVWGTTYSDLTESGTPNVFNIDGLFVVTGGSGAFEGATGELTKRGLLDRRHFPPVATALLTFVGSVVVVPEPETYALMLCGLAVLAFVVRRKRDPLA